VRPGIKSQKILEKKAQPLNYSEEALRKEQWALLKRASGLNKALKRLKFESE